MNDAAHVTISEHRCSNSNYGDADRGLHRMMIIKTSPSTLPKVVSNQMHATMKRPRQTEPGDVILIQKLIGSLAAEEKPIQYAMFLDSVIDDRDQLSAQIWGKKWNYLIKGCQLTALAQPFAIEEVQVTGKNYGQGAISFTYVHPHDAAAILEGGHLAPFL